MPTMILRTSTTVSSRLPAFTRTPAQVLSHQGATVPPPYPPTLTLGFVRGPLSGGASTLASRFAEFTRATFALLIEKPTFLVGRAPGSALRNAGGAPLALLRG